MAFFFAELKIFRIWPKTMDYNPWFDFWSPKKVMRKPYLLKEKSNGVCFCCVAPSIIRCFDQIGMCRDRTSTVSLLKVVRLPSHCLLPPTSPANQVHGGHRAGGDSTVQSQS